MRARLDDGQLVTAQTSSSVGARLVQDAPVRLEVDADAVLVVGD